MVTRPRYKDYLLVIWCLLFDWSGSLAHLYCADKKGPGVWIGEQAQRFWFLMHNNKFYRWLDFHPEDVKEAKSDDKA